VSTELVDRCSHTLGSFGVFEAPVVRSFVCVCTDNLTLFPVSRVGAKLVQPLRDVVFRPES